MYENMTEMEEKNWESKEHMDTLIGLGSMCVLMSI